MTKVGIITQARMTSTRLPGKVLKQAGGRTMLEYHLERLQKTDATVIVATTTNSADDPIQQLVESKGIAVYRGSETDVLSRYVGAAEEHNLDVIVRVTSDCPLIDSDLIQKGIHRYLSEADETLYLSNTINRTYPRGLDFEIFSATALYRANKSAHSLHEREHVTPYLYSGADKQTKIDQITHNIDASKFRITLDTSDDFILLKKLIENHTAQLMDANELIQLLNTHPELALINAKSIQKDI